MRVSSGKSNHGSNPSRLQCKIGSDFRMHNFRMDFFAVNRRFFLALLATLLSVGNPVRAQDTAVLTGKALVQELRAGGYNVYFRHAATDWSQSDHIREAGDWVHLADEQLN